MVKKKNKLVEGIIDVKQGGYGFIRDDDGNRYFVNPDRLKGAISGDIVLADVTAPADERTGKEARAAVVEILEHTKKEAVGKFTKEFTGSYIGYVDTISGNFIHRVYVRGSEVKAGNEDIVNVKITDYGERTGGIITGEVTENLGKFGEKGVDISAVIKEYNLREHFPEDVLEEAAKIPQEVDDTKYHRRRKFYGENIVTIDGEDARDFDDAIQVKKEGENYRVFIHIADPTEYVKFGSKIDIEARERGTSVYFPHRVLPMLPPSLSNGICSLNPNVKRLALTCEVLLNKNAEIIKDNVYESIIESKHRMTYTSVQKIFEGDEQEREKYADMTEDLLNANILAKKLERKAILGGKLEFESDECYIEVDENGKAIGLKKREYNDAHRLIENFMILANCVIAKKFFNMEVPFIYRTHEEPDVEKLEDFNIIAKNFGVAFSLKNKGKVTAKDLQRFLEKIKDTSYGVILSELLIRTQKKAKYETEATGHFGLGEEYYSHFTSPIRRLADLTIHRIIKSCLKNSNADIYRIWGDVADESAIQASKTELSAERAEREVDDMKKAEYMSKFIGETFRGGIISGAIASGFFVKLENTAEGFVALRNLEEISGKKFSFMKDTKEFKGAGLNFKVGSKVDVIVTSSRPEERKIDLVPVSVLNIRDKEPKL